jgi:polyisoprenoid-binding protein YceI
MSKTKWISDNSHSEIVFKAKHLMITNVTGRFGEYEVSAETEGEDFTKANVTFTAHTSSVTTGNEQRDGHLKAPDFFDVEKFPTMTFASQSIETIEGKNFTLNGNLTIRDVTRPVSVKAEILGITKDPWGNQKAGIHIETRINRKDFGLSFHVVTEAGDLLVSDNINIEGDIQFVKA